MDPYFSENFRFVVGAYHDVYIFHGASPVPGNAPLISSHLMMVVDSRDQRINVVDRPVQVRT